MIRWAPWEVVASDLAAPPRARGSLRVWRRVTAPEHGPAYWLALWLAAIAAGFAALVPVVFARGAPVTGPDVFFRLAGISFAACGLIAWRRRPDSDVGRLMTAAGFGVFVFPVLSQLGSPVALTVGALLGSVWTVAFAALVLSFVTGGRLESTIDRVVVGVFLLAMLGLQFVWMLFFEYEGNLLLVHADAQVADGIGSVQRALLIAASLAVVLVVATRWRAASRPGRRALLPSLAGSFCGLLFAGMLLGDLVTGARPAILDWATNLALLTVPAAFLAGLLRSRLARAGLADLFRELGTLRGARLQAGLARTLGDPALVLASHAPEPGAYVDAHGERVPLPAPGSGRAVASVERGGRELAIMVYDASLDDDPELVQAVCAAAAIALDDERLQAESELRLAELRASRERIVTAGDAERRRLERDLHDGAQQRLVAVALQLRMIQGRIRGDPSLAEQLVTSASDELALSLDELRELARGIHPAVLNHGLGAALDSLASRSVVATTVSYEPSERLPEPVELAAYFVACEALANVGKYARATTASVRVSRSPGAAIIEIADDGVGGADAREGSGLRGLADRVAALDGTLRVVSPPGAGTVVTAELPCES